MSEATTENESALGRLCAAYGIATSYADIWGNRVVVPQTSLIALLAEFEVDASTPERIDTALREVQSATWREGLPPVVAISAGAARWSLTVRLPETTARLRWTLTEEGGVRHRGEADALHLPERARAEIGGQVFCERRLELPVLLSSGYHTLTLDGLANETLVIASPVHCYRPPALADSERIWGPTAQLYSLRSENNWGAGDFGDLCRLVETAADIGAGIIGLNPLHALFPHNPAHASPYSPSSRLQLDVLYLDVEAIEEVRECEAAQRRVRSAEFQACLARLREMELIDYPGVAAAKLEILELLYAHFRERHRGTDTPRGTGFREFQQRGGRALRLHAIYEALQAHFHRIDGSVAGWPGWPEDYRNHDSAAVARFAADHLERVEYYEYLQWQTERQLARVCERCRARGLAVGLYLDLAVSVDRAGSDTWASPDCYALGASVGAPPDEFNPNGQDWGLPPLRPDRLRARGYRLFIDALRENMRQAGALRIDHVMGLMRLYWIPQGKAAREGTYVHYALDEMLAIVALESERNRCMVVGEDLGTVADEMRAGLVRFGLLSYRLLYFERGEGGAFKSSAAYPCDALVAVSTHDLATLAGWWIGRDLRVRLELGLLPSENVYKKQLVDRAQERVRLLLALQHAGLLPPGTVVEPIGSQTLTPALVEAIHAFVAHAPSRVMMVQVEDMIGVVEQANMPGTTGEHPNWKRKLPETLEKFAANERVRNLAAVLAKIRPHPTLHLPAMPTAGTGVSRAT
ncbi:MAG: 4-alpha-glucanotransferase [Betaproteobacteria bacterium]